MGQYNWDPIVAWLKGIGLSNRSLLTFMEIYAGRPDYAWQRSSGERLSDPAGFTEEEVYPRNPHLQLRSGEKRVKYGRVDNINPAVETFFFLLGERISNHKVKITMRLCDCLYPGVRTPRSEYDTDPEFGWYSMDLPNVMERFRSLYTPQMDVVWEGQDCREELETQREALENMGWDVVIKPAIHDTLHPHADNHYCHSAEGEWRMARFVLRSKELRGPIWAQDPCPFNYVAPDKIGQLC